MYTQTRSLGDDNAHTFSYLLPVACDHSCFLSTQVNSKASGFPSFLEYQIHTSAVMSILACVETFLLIDVRFSHDTIHACRLSLTFS